MTKNIIDIVVTIGGAVGSGLELIRSIKRTVNCNAYVLCTNDRTNRIYQSSKYVDEAHYVNNGETEEAYIESIKRWYASKEFTTKPILYFTADTHCYYIDNHREWFEEKFELCLPSSYIIKTYTQKGKAEVDAQKNGLTVPKTKIVETKSDIDSVTDQFSFPVIIKPRATYLKSGINFKIKVLDTKEDFIKTCSYIIEEINASLLCQEFIPGGDDTSYYYLFYRSKAGEIFENMGRKTLQSTPNGGIMLKGITEFNTNLSQKCKAFLNNINYVGIGGIEFKKYNNKYFFIEMSTRMEGFFKIAEDSGSNLSLASYYDMCNNIDSLNKLAESKQTDGIIYMDLVSTIKNRIKQRKFLSLSRIVFLELLNPKLKLNIYSSSDIKPYIISWAKQIK